MSSRHNEDSNSARDSIRILASSIAISPAKPFTDICLAFTDERASNSRPKANGSTTMKERPSGPPEGFRIEKPPRESTGSEQGKAEGES